MLLIDIGNSRIKWALAEEGQNELDVYADEYLQDNMAASMQGLFADIQPCNVWVSCVAGDKISQQLEQWFEQNWSVKASFAHTSRRCMGVTNAYEQVDTLGVDRWLAMLAAYSIYQQAVCVIDCGTAVTLDLLDHNGIHQGGLIMPGLQLMQRSLQAETSAIEKATIKDALLASDTASAVGNGCLQLWRKGLRSIYEDLARSFDEDLLCVITGGDGKRLAAEFNSYEYRADLVLCGLHLMARHSETL